MFDKAFKKIILIEGGYVDDPLDSGGETKYGITEEVARDFGFLGSMKDLPLDTAKQIYKTNYWDKLSLDGLSRYASENLIERLFDISVNMGVGRSGIFFQRALNVLNNRESYYRDITVDGVVGPNTINAFVDYMNYRNDDTVVVKMLTSLQGNFYIELAENREKDESFIYGWFTHRI